MDNYREMAKGDPITVYKTHMEKLLNWGIEAIREQCFTQYLATDSQQEKYCVGSTLHRGYYNPSPVYDLIVGNNKRGKLRVRAGRPKNPSHRFSFDQFNRLVCIDSYYQERVAGTEYLCYEENRILGFTVDREGVLSAVSEEVYENSRIVSFALLNCYFDNSQYICFRFHIEQYYYDAEGLQKTHFILLSPQSGQLIDENYQFYRKNGFLTGYSPIGIEPNSNRQTLYEITKKRKA